MGRLHRPHTIWQYEPGADFDVRRHLLKLSFDNRTAVLYLQRLPGGKGWKVDEDLMPRDLRRTQGARKGSWLVDDEPASGAVGYELRLKFINEHGTCLGVVSTEDNALTAIRPTRRRPRRNWNEAGLVLFGYLRD